MKELGEGEFLAKTEKAMGSMERAQKHRAGEWAQGDHKTARRYKVHRTAHKKWND